MMVDETDIHLRTHIVMLQKDLYVLHLSCKWRPQHFETDEKRDTDKNQQFLKVKKCVSKTFWKEKRRRKTDEEVREGERGNIRELMSTSSAVCQVE